jgi:hypothetical protein
MYISWKTYAAVVAENKYCITVGFEKIRTRYGTTGLEKTEPLTDY